MGVDAGTVYAEIKIALDKLQGDVNKVDQLFLHIGEGIDQQNGKTQTMTQKINTAFANMSKNGLNQFARLASGISKTFSALPIIGLISIVVGAIKGMADKVINFVKEGTAAYQTHQQELAKMNAVLTATGASAWTSTRQLSEHARELAANSTYAQDEIMKMQSVLLGFRSITGSVFTDLSSAIINMAAVMGDDLVSAANRFGKALDTPNEGLSGLSRNGFVFTNTQKALIASLVESGDKEAAQRIILDEMNNAFGDSAKAITDVISEQSRLTNETERLKRAQGEATSGIVKWWLSFRASIKGARADQQEFNNAVARASKADYSQQIGKLEELRKKLSDVTNEGERLRLTLQIEKLELELDITKAEDQLVLAQNRLDLYIKSVAIAGQQGSIYNEQTAQELRDIVAARQADVNELKKQSDEHDDVAAKRIASLNNEMDELENLDALRKEGINEVVNNEEKLSAIAQTLANAEAEARRLQKAGLISIEEMNNRILSAYQSEAGAVNTLITRVNALKTTSDTALSVQNDLLQSLNNNLTVASTNYANLYEQIKAGGKKPIDAANFKAQIDAIIEIETNAKKAIDDMLLEEGVDREALMQRRVAAEQAAANALQVLWEQHGIEIDRELRINNVGAWNDTKVVIDRAADSQKNYNERLKEQQEIQKTIDDTKQGEERAATTLREQELEYQLLLAKRTGNLDEIKRIEHEIMMFQLEQDEHFNNALIGTQEELIASQERLNRAAAGNALLDMLGDYQEKIHEIDATTAQMFEKQREEALKTAEAFKGLDGYDELIININKYYDELQKKDAIDKFTENMQQGLQYVSQAVQAISGIILAHLKKDTDERKRILDQELKDDLKRHDDKYKNLLENLDKETQARLYAMGYVEAATEEQHEVELQKSMESSDQRRIFEAESALERVRIEEEAKNNRERLEQELADTREEIEKTSAQKKVQIDYEMSMAEWRAQMAKAAISIAQAILTGYAQMGPLGGSAGAAIMGGIATTQLGAIAANKPVYTLPAFDSGGIVPGSSLWGDRILTRQNSGKMDINRHDQQALWDFIRNGSQTKQEPQIIQLTVISQLDGRVVAKNTVEYINNCQELIKRGSIV